MVLRLPRVKAENVGLRPVSTKATMVEALLSLKLKAKVRRVMWSRRAQEYETKINSGNPFSIAEVIRDLYKNTEKPDQSYSERQIYQLAVDRFIRELAAVEQIDENAATEMLQTYLKAA
jgi:CarD family transcriptional regulator